MISPHYKRRRDPLLMVSLVILIGVLGIAAFGPTQYDTQNIEQRLTLPNAEYLMGTDLLGRDLFSRIVLGARISLAIGLLTAFVSLGLGIFFGALAGMKGGFWDRWLMRFSDFIQIFPSLLIAILVSLWVGRGILGLTLSLALTHWVLQAKLVRSLFLLHKTLPYVEAARSIGVSEARIAIRHILPNLWAPIVVMTGFQIPSAILSESFLSFLGLGIEAPMTSWGALVSDGFRAIHSFPHLIVYPSLFLLATLLAFQWLGDYIKLKLDPKAGTYL